MSGLSYFAIQIQPEFSKHSLGPNFAAQNFFLKLKVQVQKINKNSFLKTNITQLFSINLVHNCSWSQIYEAIYSPDAIQIQQNSA